MKDETDKEVVPGKRGAGRTFTIRARVTDAEFHEVRAAADRNGDTVSTFTRRATIRAARRKENRVVPSPAEAVPSLA